MRLVTRAGCGRALGLGDLAEPKGTAFRFGKLPPLRLLIGLLLCAPALAGCLPELTCQKQILRHYPTADGAYEALLLQLHCALDPDLFWITVRRGRARGTGHLVAVTESVPGVRWTSSRTLRLSPERGPIFAKSLVWREIRVDLVDDGKYGLPGEHLVEWNGSYGNSEEAGTNSADRPAD